MVTDRLYCFLYAWSVSYGTLDMDVDPLLLE
jgi:hypothetical protein